MDVNGREYLARMAELFDLPADALAGLPKVELVGDRELRIENHRGILAYGREEILISGGSLLVRVRGSGLELKAMRLGELHIVGNISAVEFE